MRQKELGFTLVELMVVVVILGILASLGFSYFGKTQNQMGIKSEMNAIMTEIALKQEEYYNENGTYWSTGSDDQAYYPAAPVSPGGAPVPVNWPPLGTPTPWEPLAMSTTIAGLRCAYVTIGGPAGDFTAAGTNANAFAFPGTTPPSGDWWYAVATCDADSDPTVNSFYFRRSDTSNIYELNDGN